VGSERSEVHLREVKLGTQAGEFEVAVVDDDL
jgi:hypothetical protein